MLILSNSRSNLQYAVESIVEYRNDTGTGKIGCGYGLAVKGISHHDPGKAGFQVELVSGDLSDGGVRSAILRRAGVGS